MTRICFAICAISFLGWLSGCPHNPGPSPVTPKDADAAPGPATCLDLCRHGQALGCTWAQATPAGASCVDVCANNQAAGIAPWDLDCRNSAPTCAAVDRCR